MTEGATLLPYTLAPADRDVFTYGDEYLSEHCKGERRFIMLSTNGDISTHVRSSDNPAGVTGLFSFSKETTHEQKLAALPVVRDMCVVAWGCPVGIAVVKDDRIRILEEP